MNTPMASHPSARAASTLGMALQRARRAGAAWGSARFWIAGLLALALAVGAIAVPTLQAARAEREAESQSLRQRLLARSAAGGGPAGDGAAVQDAAGFVARFPPASQHGARLSALLATAEREGLAVRRVELRDSPVAGLPGLQQWRVSVPVAGPPGAVWAWAGRALEQDPALALLRLRLERERGRPRDGAPGPGDTVRADLEFALYARGGPTAVAP